jgi:hypothetical protein
VHPRGDEAGSLFLGCNNEAREEGVHEANIHSFANAWICSAAGLVSRALPVHTASRNCMRDEGRSFGFGNQVLIPSHRKLLRSKAMVVSIAETSGQ